MKRLVVCRDHSFLVLVTTCRIEQGVYFVAIWVTWYVELADALVQICHFHLRNGNIVKWILISYLEQFWVFLDTEHLIEELKRLILCLGFFKTLSFLILI